MRTQSDEVEFFLKENFDNFQKLYPGKTVYFDKTPNEHSLFSFTVIDVKFEFLGADYPDIPFYVYFPTDQELQNFYFAFNQSNVISNSNFSYFRLIFRFLPDPSVDQNLYRYTLKDQGDFVEALARRGRGEYILKLLKEKKEDVFYYAIFAKIGRFNTYYELSEDLMDFCLSTMAETKDTQIKGNIGNVFSRFVGHYPKLDEKITQLFYDRAISDENFLFLFTRDFYSVLHQPVPAWFMEKVNLFHDTYKQTSSILEGQEYDSNGLTYIKQSIVENMYKFKRNITGSSHTEFELLERLKSLKNDKNLLVQDLIFYRSFEVYHDSIALFISELVDDKTFTFYYSAIYDFLCKPESKVLLKPKLKKTLLQSIYSDDNAVPAILDILDVETDFLKSLLSHPLADFRLYAGKRLGIPFEDMGQYIDVFRKYVGIRMLYTRNDIPFKYDYRGGYIREDLRKFEFVTKLEESEERIIEISADRKTIEITVEQFSYLAGVILEREQQEQDRFRFFILVEKDQLGPSAKEQAEMKRREKEALEENRKKRLLTLKRGV